MPPRPTTRPVDPRIASRRRLIDEAKVLSIREIRGAEGQATAAPSEHDVLYGRAMNRLEGDPTAAQWLWFSLGFRLPPRNREWVRHELTDAGWRLRAVVRQLVLLLPIGAAFLALPGEWGLRITVGLLVVGGGLLIALAYGDSMRASRLRQHNLPVPEDPDLGRPTDSG